MAEGVVEMFGVVCFPHPWPPVQPLTLLEGEFNGVRFGLTALTDGKVYMAVHNDSRSWVTQPIAIESDRPVWAITNVRITPTELGFGINGQELLSDNPTAATFTLSPGVNVVPQEFSVNDPASTTVCSEWVKNRKSKFSITPPPRPHRRSKTIQEQGQDLINSRNRLRHLQQLVSNGNAHLLGTLAGEMRASVYWPPTQPFQPNDNWNPLLLRMASFADLPLPVYYVPQPTILKIISEAEIDVQPGNVPRIERMFLTDKICDLQEALRNGVLRIGASPGKEIAALDLVKELAHTSGAAHYDQDASEFLDVMSQWQSAQGNQVTFFMCQMADTLASLSEWVFSELKKRNLVD